MTPAATADPTLTVVLPVRDVAAYLPDMLASLEINHATLPDLQLVVVDDGSTDDTPQLISEFAGRHDWVQPVRHDQPAGLADARNAGIDAARGRFITFLDGDDWIAPGYLAELVTAVDTLGCDFVRVDHVQVHDRERVLHRAPEARRDVVLDARSGILPASRRTMVDYPYAWAGVYRRELGALLRFPSGLHTAEDRPWVWRLHREARSFAVTSLAGVFYRRLVTNSLTQLGDARQLHFLDAYADVLRQVANEPAFQTKAVRQFIVILARQLELADGRLVPELRSRLAQRAASLLAVLNPADVAAALPSDARMTLLEPLLAPDFVERRASVGAAR